MRGARVDWETHVPDVPPFRFPSKKQVPRLSLACAAGYFFRREDCPIERAVGLGPQEARAQASRWKGKEKPWACPCVKHARENIEGSYIYTYNTLLCVFVFTSSSPTYLVPETALGIDMILIYNPSVVFARMVYARLGVERSKIDWCNQTILTI